MADVIPIRLTVDGFLSWRDETTVDFASTPVAAIVGPNGAGKTALVEAIGWALFGKGRGRSPDDFVNAVATRCRVEYVFAIGGATYRVERQRELGRNPTSYLALDVAEPGGEWRSIAGDAIAETQRRIDGVLGMDFDTWAATSYIGQGKADAFTRLGPADRKALLADVLGLDEYAAWADAARERARAADKAAAVARSRIEDLDRTIEAYDPDEASRAAVAEGAAAARVADADKAVRKTSADHEVAVDAVHQIERLTDALASERRDRARARDAARAALDRATAAEREARERLREAQGRITETRRGTCPTCRRKLAPGKIESLVAEVEPEVAHWLDRATRSRAEAETAAEVMAVAEQETDAERDLSDRLDQIARPDVEGTARAAAQARESRAAAGRVHADAAAALAVANDRARTIDDAREARGSLDGDRLLAMETADTFGVLADAFGRDGIPALLIDDAIPAIADEANRLLDRLTAGRLSVTMETRRATKTAGVRETLDVAVADDVSDRLIESLSGGERQAVDLALRIGLARVLAHRAGRRIESLIIDEGFTALDAGARQRTVGVVHDLIGEFAAVLFVTHLRDLADAFPERITVARRGGASVIEGAA